MPASLYGKEKSDERRTPAFKVEVPKDHFYLVAVDRGEEGNRLFLTSDHPGARGVDPVTGNMMREPGTVTVSLGYPAKRNNSRTTPLWTVYAGHSFTTKETLGSGGEVKTDWRFELGYNFKVATEIQRIIYQSEGQVHKDYEKNIIETPIEPELQEVETGIDGINLYQIPFGEVDGVERYIVILISDDFNQARRVLAISDENPKFSWSGEWFHDAPISK